MIIYILVKDGIPLTGGHKKYHIKQFYETLSEEDKKGITLMYCSNATKYIFVERTIGWLYEYGYE